MLATDLSRDRKLKWSDVSNRVVTWLEIKVVRC